MHFAKPLPGETVEKYFNSYLSKTISIRDTAVRKDRKESFYHGVLLGILSHKGDWDVISNAESRDGYGDILVEFEENIGIVIELKYSENEDMEDACQKALKQIEARLTEDGMGKIIWYGIACRKKKCRVAVFSKDIYRVLRYVYSQKTCIVAVLLDILIVRVYALQEQGDACSRSVVSAFSNKNLKMGKALGKGVERL